MESVVVALELVRKKEICNLLLMKAQCRKLVPNLEVDVYIRTMSQNIRNYSKIILRFSDRMTPDDHDTWPVMSSVFVDAELEYGIHFSLNDNPEVQS